MAPGLIAADIKRFLERPIEPVRSQSTFDAPPGAPIGGDTGMDWLASPSWCGWDDRIDDCDCRMKIRLTSDGCRWRIGSLASAIDSRLAIRNLQSAVCNLNGFLYQDQ